MLRAEYYASCSTNASNLHPIKGQPLVDKLIWTTESPMRLALVVRLRKNISGCLVFE